MVEHKHKIGDILRHRLTEEKVIITRRLISDYVDYKIRRPNYSEIEVREEELEIDEQEKEITVLKAGRESWRDNKRDLENDVALKMEQITALKNDSFESRKFMDEQEREIATLTTKLKVVENKIAQFIHEESHGEDKDTVFSAFQRGYNERMKDEITVPLDLSDAIALIGRQRGHIITLEAVVKAFQGDTEVNCESKTNQRNDDTISRTARKSNG